MTTVLHVGSEITRGTRSKSASITVVIFKLFGSEIVLSKVEAHILFLIRKIAFKHKCHFKGRKMKIFSKTHVESPASLNLKNHKQR